MARIIDVLKRTVKNRRVLRWELGGMVLYSTPALIRFVTRTPRIPLLNEPNSSSSPYIPPNLVEKILINMFFPGGAGSVAGETLVDEYKSNVTTKLRYAFRLVGAWSHYALWTAIQYTGYKANIIGPHGQNVFEGPEVYLFNLLLATLSIFTPDILDYVKNKLYS